MPHRSQEDEPGRVELQRTIWRMRAAGMANDAIAEKLGISVVKVRHLLKVAQVLAATELAIEAKEHVALQAAQYDGLIERWSAVARNPDHPNGPAGAAVIIRCLEAKAKLLGLNGADVGDSKPAPSLQEALRSPEAREALRLALAQADRDAKNGVVDVVSDTDPDAYMALGDSSEGS